MRTDAERVYQGRKKLDDVRLGNSAHSVIVVTLLPIFFSSVAGFMRNTTSAMSIWGYVTSIAMLISALLAPVIGRAGRF